MDSKDSKDSKDSEDSIMLLRRQLLKSAKEGVRLEFSGKDFPIVKAIGVLDDLDRVFNLMAEHCISWHSMHFPELKEFVSDNDQLLRLISELGKREEFEEENILKILGDEELAEKLSKAAKDSMGSDISEKDLAQISELAVNALRIKEERKKTEDFVEAKISGLAPNFSQVAGTLLAARLLAKAGSLKALALMPSSKMQTLGAEKALFRHLRTKGKALPPKYGLIFQHSLIQQLKPWQQGGMARSLAGKISIAVRKDFFNDKPKADSALNDKLQSRFSALEKKKQGVKKKTPEKFSRENPMLPKKFQQGVFPQRDSQRGSGGGGFEKRPFVPRGDFRPRNDFQQRNDFRPRSEGGFQPRGDFRPRGDFQPRRGGEGSFQPRSEFKPRGEFQPRGDFRPRNDFQQRNDSRPRGEFPPKGDFKPREGFKPAGSARKKFYESPGMKKFNNAGVDFKKLKSSKDFKRNAFKKPGKLRFAKTKE